MTLSHSSQNHVTPSVHWADRYRDALADADRNDRRRALRQADPILGTPRIRVGDRELINLASNDYLGLAGHPKCIAAAEIAAKSLGVGSGASRLVSGHHAAHALCESRFAQLKYHGESNATALLCPTGYTANLAAITALASPGDFLCQDKLNHASLIDAARMSGADTRTYPHLNLTKLDRLLSSRSVPDTAHRFIITDAVFSMDGDTANLPALADLADKHNAILIVDEAHATGILGPTGAGLAEAQNVSERIDLSISTASKALGSLGGIIASPHPELIDTIINRGRAFIYTTGATPIQAATITAALDILRDEPAIRDKLHRLIHQLRAGLSLPHTDHPTPIIPIITGTDASALTLRDKLFNAGFFAPAIRPPTVAPNTARIRITLRADLDPTDIDRLIKILNSHPAPV